jgi:hypothetical protein
VGVVVNLSLAPNGMTYSLGRDQQTCECVKIFSIYTSEKNHFYFFVFDLLELKELIGEIFFISTRN